TALRASGEAHGPWRTAQGTGDLRNPAHETSALAIFEILEPVSVVSVVPSSWRVGTTDSHCTINRQNTRFLEHAVNGSGGTRLAPPCRSNVTVRRRPNASARAATSIRRIRA